MPLPVKLSEVVDQLSCVGDELNVYFNTKTGEFVLLTSEDMVGFDEDVFDEDGFDEEDLFENRDDNEQLPEPEWMREARQIRREVFESDDYIQLPEKFDINDWQIMQDFCLSQRRADVRAELLDLIKGRGAFSRFNSAIRGLRLEKAWFDFKNETYERIALDWLEANKIPFIHDSQIATAKSQSHSFGRGPTFNEFHSETAAATAVARKPKEPQHEQSRRKDEQPPRKPLEELQPKSRNENEIKVFISNRDSKCDECGEQLGRKAWITLEENKGALCLSCADLDELVFLPTGDAALTRRSKKYSTLWALVLKFSRARGRYERQGLLVEESALQQAEAECLADSDVRDRRNERARERRAELDQQYIDQFAKRIRALYPNCPKGREQTIAEHACLKYSGRVGRSAAAKSFEDEAVRLAVAAHLRHRETNYDSLLAKGWFRGEARVHVRERVEALLANWQQSNE